MDISDFIKNTVPFYGTIEESYIIKFNNPETAQWYEAKRDFSLWGGVKVQERDLMLFDTTTGELKGIFRPIRNQPIESTSDNKQTDTSAI